MSTAGPAAPPVSPSHEDPVVRGASELIGGPPGRHAVVGARRGWWTPLRVLLALVVVACCLGYAQKAACRDTRNWSEESQYTSMCYSDVVALYSQEGLREGKIPYLDYPTEYPPLIGATMALASAFAGLGSAQEPVYRTENGQQVVDHYTIDGRSALFYDLTALLFLIAAGVTVVLIARTAGERRPWDAALFALAPALVLHLLTNWDMVALVFATAAIYAWSRRAPTAAGVLLGLAVTSKLYPALFLVALGALCLRTGRLRAFARTVVATVITIIAVMLPLWLVAGYFDGETKVYDGILQTMVAGGDWVGMLDGSADGAHNALTRFYELNQQRPADWDSIAFALQWLATEHDPRWFGGAHLAIAAVVALGLAVVAGLLLRDRLLRALAGEDERATAAGTTAATAGAAGADGAQRWRRSARPVLLAAAGCWSVVALGAPVLLTAIRDHGLPVGVLNTVTAAALIVAVLAIVALCLLAPRRPRLPQVLFLLVVAFLLTNKVFSPQYTLWLLPLVALARPKWRMFLVWQVTEAYVLFTRFMHFVYNDTQGADGVNRGWFVGAITLRDLALLVLAALVVREILRPELDVVRASGLDDPAGGILDGAPDHPAVTRAVDRVLERLRLRRPAALATAGGPAAGSSAWAAGPDGPGAAPTSGRPGDLFRPSQRSRSAAAGATDDPWPGADATPAGGRGEAEPPG